MGVEQLYFIIGFLLGVLVMSCVCVAACIIWYEWHSNDEQLKQLMIICICRNIKQSDFETKEELIKRIMELDHNCGQCQQFCNEVKLNTEKITVNLFV